MKRRVGDKGTGCRSRRAPVIVASIVSSLVIATCSSGANTTGSVSRTPETGPTITLAADLPDKAAVDGIKSTFTSAGINPDVVPEVRTQLVIPQCPLGQADRLTAAAPVSGLTGKATTTLQLSRDLIAAVNCTFSNDPQAGSANSIPPPISSITFVEYQASYVPGARLQSYLTLLESQGFEKQPGTTVGGVVYTHCVESAATSPTIVASYRNCSAVWLNGVIEVGLHFAGPNGQSVDLVSWLGGMVEPIVNALANTTATPVSVPTS